MNSFDRGRIFISIFIILGQTIIAGCRKEDQPPEINLEKREPLKTVERQSARKTVRIAVGGMVTPKEGFACYRRLLDYDDSAYDSIRETKAWVAKQESVKKSK